MSRPGFDPASGDLPEPRYVVRKDYVGDYVILDTEDDVVIPFGGTVAAPLEAAKLNAGTRDPRLFGTIPASEYPPLEEI